MTRRNRAGRKRKDGARYKGGKLRPVWDRGNPRVEVMRAKFGEHYSTGLGRAFATGLLDRDGMKRDEELGKHRYQAGKRFARLSARFFPDGYRCPLDRTPRGGNPLDGPRDAEDWIWFLAASDRIGFAREWIAPLLIVTDAGPQWLDDLLAQRNLTAPHLANALLALDLIAGPLRKSGIVAQTY